ncbi:hypothetical protein ACLF3G_28850 [Falsiroseomonas sp. HC035]|uniref:hypothetical protein n=1 Tax=Falsiroseomonas sp. HC035 TaxID=3390999 RepID=UPI003D310B11
MRRSARERTAVAEAWQREVVARPEVAAELRLVHERVPEALRRAAAVRQAPGAQRPREGLAGVAGRWRPSREAHEEREQARERARQAEQERLSPRRGRGMRM